MDEEPFITEHANLIRFERVLDMRQGRLERSIIEEMPSGKRVEIRSTRLVSFVTGTWLRWIMRSSDRQCIDERGR